MSTQPALQLSEAELSFQAVVDPYAKADFFLSAGPEGLDVEEGYITFTSLPGNMLLKVGKMRAQFGKVNTLHSHAMPTADRPLVTENLVGGEDGLSDAGMSVSHLVQTSALYLELTGEVFAGTSNVFQSQQRSDLNYVGRVRAYHDLTENSNIDLGTSYAFGPTDVGQTATLPAGVTPTTLNKSLYGIDATYRYRPLRRAIYKRFNARTELIWSRQDLPAGDQTTAFGWYGLGEYQFARRWYLGRPLRSIRPRARRLAPRQRRVVLHDVLAERVQPDSRPVPADQLRGRRPRERVPLPVQLCHRRARRAHFLRHSQGPRTRRS